MAAIDSTNYRPQTGLLAGPPGDVDYPRLNSLPPSDQPLFYHARLNLARKNIRVLHVLPDLSSDALIQCTLEETLLTDKHTCLSYRWGSEEGQRNILVNARLLRIRANLWHFLQLARHNYADRSLWIDAICIDQENRRERGHQVSLMGDIYAKAKEVLVYLGRGSSNVGRAMAFLRSDAAMDLQRVTAWTISSSVWDGLVELCHLLYWKRVWIKQELINASDATLIWGYYCCAWEELARVLLSLKEKRSQSRQYVSRLQRDTIDSPAETLAEVYFSRTLLSGNRRAKEDPITLIPKFCFSDCAVSHDRVYGLLGLTILDGKFPVDYWCTPEKLLINLFVYCRDFQFLEFHSGDERRQAQLSQLLQLGANLVRALEVNVVDLNNADLQNTKIERSATSRLKDCLVQDRLQIWSRFTRTERCQSIWRTSCHQKSLQDEDDWQVWTSLELSRTSGRFAFRQGDTVISSGNPFLFLLRRAGDQTSNSSKAVAWVVLKLGFDGDNNVRRMMQVFHCEGIEQIRFEHSESPYPYIPSSRETDRSPSLEVPITLPMTLVVKLVAALQLLEVANQSHLAAGGDPTHVAKLPDGLREEYRPSKFLIEPVPSHRRLGQTPNLN